MFSCQGGLIWLDMDMEQKFENFHLDEWFTIDNTPLKTNYPNP